VARDSAHARGHVASEREERQVRDTYGVALVMVLSATLALVAAGSPLISPLAVGAAMLQVGALILTLRVSGWRARQTVGISVVVVVMFAVIVAMHIFGGDVARVPALLTWLALSILTIAAIARRLVTYSAVTVQMLMGLLVIYILIGVSFGLAYMLSNEFWAPALKPENFGISGALYYSFITLATVGYGDLVTGTDLARAMAIGEALIGQLYLVSVVSFAVSRLGTRRMAERIPDGQMSVEPTPDAVTQAENIPVTEEPLGR